MPKLLHPSKLRCLGALLLLLSASACGMAQQPTGADQNGKAAEMQAKIAMDVARNERAAGDAAQAIDYYRSARELDPSRWVAASTGLGDTLLEIGKPNEAAEAYREALTRSPNNGPALNGLGVALVKLDQPAAAIDALHRGLATTLDPRAFRALGVAEDLLGRFGDAVADCQNGLVHFPDEQGLREDLGLSQAFNGDFDAAIATMRAAAASPNAAVRDQLNLALVLGLAGHTTEAAQVAAANMDEASVQNNLAYYAHLRAISPGERVALLLRSSAATMEH